MYPHYAPTHRIGKGVGGAATSVSTGLGTKKQANKLTGSDREIINLEDQYAEMIQTIIRANRLNSVYSSIVNSALAKDTTEYQVRQGLTQMSKALTAANKEARGMQDGPEKDAVKGEAIELTKLLLDYYDRCMSGEIGDPLNYAKLYSHDETVRDGLLSLGADILNDENNKIMPNDTYAPSSLADPSRKGYTYYLETDEREVYKGFYISGYDQVVKPVVSSSSFKSADAERKIEMLEAARDQARDLARENFFNWLRKNNYRSEPTRK